MKRQDFLRNAGLGIAGLVVGPSVLKALPTIPINVPKRRTLKCVIDHYHEFRYGKYVPVPELVDKWEPMLVDSSLDVLNLRGKHRMALLLENQYNVLVAVNSDRFIVPETSLLASVRRTFGSYVEMDKFHVMAGPASLLGKPHSDELFAICARTTRTSISLPEDLKSVYGIEGETELTSILVEELKPIVSDVVSQYAVVAWYVPFAPVSVIDDNTFQPTLKFNTRYAVLS